MYQTFATFHPVYWHSYWHSYIARNCVYRRKIEIWVVSKKSHQKNNFTFLFYSDIWKFRPNWPICLDQRAYIRCWDYDKNSKTLVLFDKYWSYWKNFIKKSFYFFHFTVISYSFIQIDQLVPEMQICGKWNVQFYMMPIYSKTMTNIKKSVIFSGK